MKRAISLILVLALWGSLAAFAWLKPPAAFSDAERRPLEQFPSVSGESLTSGGFMTDFADYAVDQFPLRDSFRTLNAWLTYYLLGKKDNNGIYLSDGYAARMEYPLNESSIANAIQRFTELYEMYLTGCDVRFALVPDKSYYLAQDAGALSLDYDALYERMAESLPWADFIDLRENLTIDDYYRTDTHWRQETLLPAAETICDAMGIAAPRAEDFTTTKVEHPFYGVYYGQAALPMEPDVMYLLESDLLKNCTVYDHESGRTVSVYDDSRLESKDLYEVFLSGPRGLLTIRNPAGEPGRELIVFRDSFGSAMIPLLLTEYETITVADIRYLQIDLLDRFVDFRGQDVLLLYSTLVLNNGETIK